MYLKEKSQYFIVTSLLIQKLLFCVSLMRSRKFHIERDNNKFDSIETRHIVIARLLPSSDLEKCMYNTLH